MSNNCCNECDPCKPKCCADPCGCPHRVLSVEAMPDQPGVVKFNLDGHTELFDFSDIVAATETDTFLRVDGVSRTLKYLAEGHTNNISAKDLGSILHLGDIGDVDMGEVEQNSLLVYQKDSECGQGCDEISNQWIAWNASDPDNLEDSAKTLMAFNDNDAPVAIQPPIHTNQHYLLGWRAGDKIGYEQPAEVTVPSVSGDDSFLMFMNPVTKQVEALKVKVEIDASGVMTFKTQGAA